MGGHGASLQQGEGLAPPLRPPKRIGATEGAEHGEGKQPACPYGEGN